MNKTFNRDFGKDVITLNPGEYVAVQDDVVISTLLGSCVAACLYDPERRVIGMNHFMLVSKLDNPEKFFLQKEGRYALNAMELLINELMKMGAKKSSLRAKAFGGASTNKGLRTSGIPESNVEFIRSFLKGEGINLMASDFGGTVGRKIFFFNDRDYTVLQRRIMIRDLVTITKVEEHYLKRQRTFQREEE